MKYFFLITLLFAAYACHKKAVPEMTDRTHFPPPPRSAKLDYDVNPEVIATGKLVYQGKCNQCHELKDTRIYTKDRWSVLLKTMIPRAKLDSQQARQVISYVMANAKG